MGTYRFLPAVAVLALCGVPVEAHAHLTSTGVGPFYDGATHVLASPDQVLPLLALCLFGGLRGKSAGRSVLLGLPVAMLLGAIGGYWMISLPFTALAMTLLLLVLGGFVAADVSLPHSAVVAAATGCGLLIGFANGATMAEARLGAVSLVGVAATGLVMAALLTASVVSLRRTWMRIAVRVAGSWLVALGLLMAAWSV